GVGVGGGGRHGGGGAPGGTGDRRHGAWPSLTPERGQARVADRVHRTQAVDAPVARRAGIAARRPACVVLDQRLRLRVIDAEPLLHRLLVIVVALDQWLTRGVVLSGDLRRVVLP